MTDNFNHSIQKRMRIAEKICKERKERLTPLRSDLLKLMYKQHNPISAYDLLKLLKKTYPNAEAMTVYRVLNFWINIGLLHKLSINNTYAVCIHPDEEHYAQFLLCKNCGMCVEIKENNLAKQIKNILDKNNFSVIQHPIEIFGLCQNCVAIH